MGFATPQGALTYLRTQGALPDGDMDLAECAIALGLIFLPGLSPDRYRQHLRKMEEQVGEIFSDRGDDTAQIRADVLRHVIHTLNGYEGDNKTYDDIQNANFIRVIERRKGLPVALGIIYIALARRMGWDCEGLNFPGHFVLRIEKDGERLILDPFNEGREMHAADLRQLLKSIAGNRAELSHNFYDAVSNRDILLRLENNLKKRLIDGEDYAGAIVAADAIEAFSPDEYRTWLDKGVLQARLGDFRTAVASLETYIEKAPLAQEKEQGRLLLQQIKAELDA